jgi:molybdopterin converting factor small subunit
MPPPHPRGGRSTGWLDAPALNGNRQVQITVRLGAPLSQVVGETKVQLALAEGASLADLLEQLRDRSPAFEAGLMGEGLRRPSDRVLYTLFCNARPVPFERAAQTQLRDGDQVYIFLPVGGGQ